jgi:hypothetical protein
MRDDAAIEGGALGRLLLASQPEKLRQLQVEVVAALRVDPSALGLSALPSPRGGVMRGDARAVSPSVPATAGGLVGYCDALGAAPGAASSG